MAVSKNIWFLYYVLMFQILAYKLFRDILSKSKEKWITTVLDIINQILRKGFFFPSNIKSASQRLYFDCHGFWHLWRMMDVILWHIFKWHRYQQTVVIWVSKEQPWLVAWYLKKKNQFLKFHLIISILCIFSFSIVSSVQTLEFYLIFWVVFVFVVP